MFQPLPARAKHVPSTHASCLELNASLPHPTRLLAAVGASPQGGARRPGAAAGASEAGEDDGRCAGGDTGTWRVAFGVGCSGCVGAAHFLLGCAVPQAAGSAGFNSCGCAVSAPALPAPKLAGQRCRRPQQKDADAAMLALTPTPLLQKLKDVADEFERDLYQQKLAEAEARVTEAEALRERITELEDENAGACCCCCCCCPRLPAAVVGAAAASCCLLLFWWPSLLPSWVVNRACGCCSCWLCCLSIE